MSWEKLEKPPKIKIVGGVCPGSEMFIGLEGFLVETERGCWGQIALVALAPDQAEELDCRWRKRYNQDFPFSGCHIDGLRKINGLFYIYETLEPVGQPQGYDLYFEVRKMMYQQQDLRAVKAVLRNPAMLHYRRGAVCGENSQGDLIEIIPRKEANGSFTLLLGEYASDPAGFSPIAAEILLRDYPLETFIVEERPSRPDHYQTRSRAHGQG